MHNSNKLSEEEQNDLLARKVGEESLIDFCNVIDYRYQANWHHEIIAEKLEEALEKVLKGEKSRIILEMPPRHGKSELATVKFPAWVLGKYPDIPVITVSYAADLAVDFGLKTRDIMNDEDYQAIFDTRIRPDVKAKGKWLTKEGGGYTAVGVGGAITGKGFKIGIIDDPIKNREEADSFVDRESKWKWYISTFYTRQDGYGAIVVICTRWHLDDLVGRLLEREEENRKAGLKEFDEWEIIRFPAVAEEDEEFRKKGDPLWPEKFSAEFLENTKNTIGVFDWASLYQQNPIMSEAQEFKKEWFKYFEEEDIKGKNLIFTTTVDPAISKGLEASNSVVRTVGKARDNPNWYLMEETVGKMDPLQLIDAIFYHYEKYRGSVWIELVAYQKALEFYLIEEQKKRNVYFSVNELKRNRSQSKEIRIRGLIPLYKAGVIFHRRADMDLETELLQFPKGKLDDRADALASQLEAVKHTQAATTYKPKPYIPMSEYEGK